MSDNRRNFLKLFGATSAAMVGTNGMPETVKLEGAEPKPRQPIAGSTVDHAQWNDGIPEMDVISGVLYDRLDIPKNGLQHHHRFFGRGLGPERGLEQTNVWQQNALCAPEMFKIEKFGITFQPSIKPELRDAIIKRYCVEFWLGQKVYFRAPMVEAYGGPNSDPTIDFKTLYTLNLPIILVSGHYFSLEMTSADPLPINPKLALWGVIHGMHARGVQ